MAKLTLKCPSDDTLPAIMKCWSAGAADLQANLTALIFKNVECECDCDPFVIVTVTEVGDCPGDATKKEFSVVVRLGCIDLTDDSQEFFFKEMKPEEGMKALAAMVANLDEKTVQKKC